MKIGIYRLNRSGYAKDLPAMSTDIYGANIIMVTAGTNGRQGGDSGHGGQSFFEIIDEGGTDISVSVDGKEFVNPKCITISVGGDSELSTLIEALKFGAKALQALGGSSSLRSLATEPLKCIQ